MKIGFTVDTNILQGRDGRSTNLEKNLSFFLDYIKAITKKDKVNSLTFYITDIVKDEVIFHEKRYMQEDYDNYIKSFNKARYILKGNKSESYLEDIIKKEEEFSKKLNILKLKRTEEKFNKIIKSSIEKIPPFIKSNGDAGFKDALIWECILDSNEIDSLDIFYYFTTDKDFNDYRLIKEFESVHENTKIKIEIISNDGQKRQNVINKIIDDNSLIHTDITTLFNEKYILRYIHKLSNEKLENKSVEYTLKYDDLNENDFDIIDVVNAANKFKVLIRLDTYIAYDNVYMPISGDLELIMHKNSDDYFCESHSLTNVIFGIPDLNDYFDSIRKMSNLAYGITNEPFKNVKGIIGAITTSEIINSTLESVNKYNESLKQVTEGLKIPKISNTFQSISEGVIDKKIIDSFKNNKIDNNNNQ